MIVLTRHAYLFVFPRVAEKMGNLCLHQHKVGAQEPLSLFAHTGLNRDSPMQWVRVRECAAVSIA